MSSVQGQQMKMQQKDGETPPILIVDDDPTQRMMYRSVLEGDGHRVIEAENGEQGIDLFRKYQPNMILLDAIMPGMDGFETCRRLQTLDGGEIATVLLATSLNDDESVTRAFEAGADDFISKPINWAVLRGRVRRLVQSHIAQQQMRAAEEQLSQSNKMQAIGTLSSGISHEFNNILASVMGYTELLQEFLKAEAHERQERYANEIYSASERARDLITQMQLFSRTMPGDAKRLESVPLLTESMRMLRSSLPSNIQINQYLDKDIPPINIDPVQFQQLLTNLLINARDAMEGSGIVNLYMRKRRVTEQPCDSCHHTFSGEFVELTVEDSGSGIPEDVKAKIFEPYFTTKPVGRGTGMGLPVAHGIVHDQQGHIKVESSEGNGTRVSILLPVAVDTQFKLREVSMEDAMANQGDTGKSVLLVDDEVTITGYLSEMLEIKGFSVTCCNNSQEALSNFVANPEGYDIVITDMTLPGMTGVELARGMLAVRPDLPIILCSGYIDEEKREEIQQAGIREFFNKPVDSGQLIQAIHSQLNGAAVEA